MDRTERKNAEKLFKEEEKTCGLSVVEESMFIADVVLIVRNLNKVMKI